MNEGPRLEGWKMKEEEQEERKVERSDGEEGKGE